MPTLRTKQIPDVHRRVGSDATTGAVVGEAQPTVQAARMADLRQMRCRVLCTPGLVLVRQLDEVCVTMTLLTMQAQIDEIAAIKTCWHTDCGYRPPPPPRTSPEACPCVPKAVAIAVARQVADELPTRIRWFPTGDGGLIAECFDDPPTIMFRGTEVTVIDVFADGTVWALGVDDQEHQWPSPVHMTAVANGQYIRASNDCPCPTCGRPYRQHPLLATFDWLNVLCDGTLVKL